jgi:Flp pilus assembly protein TadG
MDKPMRRRVRGIAVIWLAVTAVVLIGLLGLVIDSGFAYLTASQLQNAADAAASGREVYS